MGWLIGASGGNQPCRHLDGAGFRASWSVGVDFCVSHLVCVVCYVSLQEKYGAYAGRSSPPVGMLWNIPQDTRANEDTLSACWTERSRARPFSRWPPCTLHTRGNLKSRKRRCSVSLSESLPASDGLFLHLRAGGLGYISTPKLCFMGVPQQLLWRQAKARRSWDAVFPLTPTSTLPMHLLPVYALVFYRRRVFASSV